MAEKVLFSIKGLHTVSGVADEEPEEIEVMNVAEYSYRNRTHYIMYEEIMDGTNGPTRNLVKIKPDSVEITRKGEGHNWWCVMYPNLCFSNSLYRYNDKEWKRFQKTLTPREYRKILESGNYTIRFKFLEYLKKKR